MFPFRKKSFTYQTLPTLSNEDGDVSHPKVQASRGVGSILDKLRPRKSQSLFFLFCGAMLTYIILNLIMPLPRNWLPFDNGTNRGFIVIPTFKVEISTVNLSNAGDIEMDGSTTTQTVETILNEIPSEVETDEKSDQSVTPQTQDKMACKFPKLDPFDPSIKDFVMDIPSVNCTDIFPLLFSSTLNSTVITIRNVQEVYSNVSSCCYQTLVRGKSRRDPDNVYILSKTCFPLPLSESSVTIIPPDHEYIAISCKFQKAENTKKSSKNPVKKSEPDTYSKIVDMHVFVHEKPAVEERIEKYYANLSSKKQDQGNNNALEKDRVNVVVLGIDAVSHMNFLRTMPKSRSFLLENLSAVEMKGFNKAGDNTFPNLAVGLAYLNKSAVEATCEKNGAYDKCPFIWKQYAANGYRTSYGEDSTWMGIFNYLKTGFVTPPTDYYLRPFGVAAEKLIGTHRPSNAKLCYGPRMSFEVLLQYVRKFAFSMGFDKRYFQFIWATSLTHDELNYGKMGDDHLLSTLKWFHEEGYFNRTIFILMSDHGIRWGKIHQHLQGQLEERLPFLYFVAPLWFKQKYKRAYENLNLNQNRLTTYYDFHETLLDLLNLTRLDSGLIAEKEHALSISDRNGELPIGISHFLPIPTSRTCEMSGIEEHYCTCHRFKEAKNGPEVAQAANFVVHHINSLISRYPQCGFLSLGSIKTAHEIDFGFDTKKWKDEMGFELTIVTSPGDAVFQASIMKKKKGAWRVSGTISRTSLYGNQSHCIDKKDLKLYCYCIDDLKLR